MLILTRVQEESMSGYYHYDLALPPRQVPWLVRNQVLFGGFMPQFGWVFLGFGLIFVWIFGLNADLSGILFSLSERETAQGMVLRIEATNATINDTQVYGNTYSFRVESLETEYQGVSYSTGRQLEPGWPVTVEYIESDPNVSRIHGMRRAMFAWPVLCIVLLFPLIGLFFIVFGLKKGVKANRLLAQGKIALGALKSKEPTNIRVNERPVYKLVFEFIAADGGRYEIVSKTSLPDRLEDESEERLLYDPDNPAYAVMLDNLPGSPDIDELGRIRAGSFLRGMLPLLLPALTLLVHGTIFLTLVIFL
jgi:hypothetical protein